MKKFIFVFLFSFHFSSYAQNSFVNNYTDYFGSINFLDLASAPNCDLYVCGYSNGSGNFFLTRLNNDLDTLWTKKIIPDPQLIGIGDPYVQPNKWAKISVGNDGVYGVMGFFKLQNPIEDQFYVIFKTDLDGNIQWSKFKSDNFFYSKPIIKARNNYLYLLAHVGTNDSLRFYKFNANGDCINKKSFHENLESFYGINPKSIQIDENDALTIVGDYASYDSNMPKGFYSFQLDSSFSFINGFRVFSPTGLYKYSIKNSFTSLTGTDYFVCEYDPNNFKALRLSKKYKNSNQIYSKIIQTNNNSKNRIYLGSSDMLNPNLISVNGVYLDFINNFEYNSYPFQINLDTSFNILNKFIVNTPEQQSYLYSGSSTRNCHSIFTYINYRKNFEDNYGLIIKQNNVFDSFCNQLSLSLKDSILSEFIDVSMEIYEENTSNLSTISCTTSPLQLFKNTCFNTSLLENASETDFIIYPNPAYMDINLFFDKSNYKNYNISVYNTIGQLFYTQNESSSNQNLKVDISHFPSGVYTVVFRTSSQANIIKKLIVQKFY
jgi:hypothetical protein